MLLKLSAQGLISTAQAENPEMQSKVVMEREELLRNFFLRRPGKSVVIAPIYLTDSEGH